MNQKSLKTKITVEGIGLHSGKKVNVTLNPAKANAGISFTRTDIAKNPHIPITPKAVTTTQLQTVICNPHGVSVATVEHLLSALYALEITNCHIEINAEEAPILDGSASPWVQAINKTGIEKQPEPCQILTITKPIKITEGESILEALPTGKNELSINITVNFPTIGQQKLEYILTPQTYIKQIAPARTFCQQQDIKAMEKAGLIKGGTLDCAVVFDNSGNPVNPENLRFENEPVRHKLLDAIGDLSLGNRRIHGHLNLTRPGHKLNNLLLQKLIN